MLGFITLFAIHYQNYEQRKDSKTFEKRLKTFKKTVCQDEAISANPPPPQLILRPS